MQKQFQSDSGSSEVRKMIPEMHSLYFHGGGTHFNFATTQSSMGFSIFLKSDQNLCNSYELSGDTHNFMKSSLKKTKKLQKNSCVIRKSYFAIFLHIFRFPKATRRVLQRFSGFSRSQQHWIFYFLKNEYTLKKMCFAKLIFPCQRAGWVVKLTEMI